MTFTLRFASVLLMVCLFGLQAKPAPAALVWAESTQNGYPLTHWARGASIEEATNLMHAYVGPHPTVLLSCRQPGWFAYVGSDHDFRRGVSCGFDTRSAALLKAKMECHAEGGDCDLERVSYDKGNSTLGDKRKTVPDALGAAIDQTNLGRTELGPKSLQTFPYRDER